MSREPRTVDDESADDHQTAVRQPDHMDALQLVIESFDLPTTSEDNQYYCSSSCSCPSSCGSAYDCSSDSCSEACASCSCACTDCYS